MRISKFEERLPSKPIGYLDLAGKLAVYSANPQDYLRINEVEIFGGQVKDKALAIADTLIVIASKSLEPDNPEWELPLSYMVEELSYLSRGYSEKERADLYEVSVNYVKSMIRKVKKELGANTRSHTVVKGIQQGFIPIRVDKDAAYQPLSTREIQTLTLTGAGWTSKEIAAYLDLSVNTIDRHVEELREKLNAKNLPHAVRRAFEVGIFKVGEPIDLQQPGSEIKILIPSAEDVFRDLDIRDIRKVEILRIMADLGTGWVSSRLVLAGDFYKGASDRARREEYGRAMVALSRELEELSKKPIIGKKRVRIDGNRTYIYCMQTDLVVEIDDKQVLIPAYKEPPATLKTPSRSIKKAKAEKKPKTELRPRSTQKSTTTEDQVEEKNEAISEEPNRDLDPANDLPPLHEALLETLVPRNPEEVLFNNGVKRAVNFVASREANLDYKTKVVFAVRYGVPSAFMNLFTIRRGQEYISPNLLEKFIPAYQGLDLKSAFLVTGIPASELYKLEKEFINKYKLEFPELEGLSDYLDREMESLEQKTAS